MFSVIIPLYNKEKYIQKAIKSVLNQTYKNFELIIINDGSTDNSLMIGQQLSDYRLRIINQPNLGVSAARNNGVRLAKYNNIAFLDADDWWDSNFLEEMYKLIIDYPDAGLYGCKYNKVKNGKLIPSQIGLESNFSAGYINYFEVYAKTFWVPINCTFAIIKKNVFDDFGGFDVKLKFGEDFHLWVRVALKYQVGYLNKNLAYSNQDVDVNQRALGADKLYNKKTHYIFNLSFLDDAELENHQLKLLLDGLRVRALMRYYLAGVLKSDVKREIEKVDFSQQSAYYKFIYKYPKFLVTGTLYFKKMSSRIKQFLIKKKLL